MSNYPDGVKPADFDDEKEMDCPDCGGSGRAECDCDKDHVIECPKCDGMGCVPYEPDYDRQAKEAKDS